MNTDCKFIRKWKKEMMRSIKLMNPQLDESEVMRKLDEIVERELEDTQVQIYNNYKEKTVDISLLELTEFIYNKEPIMCASGVMFKRHDEAFSPINKMTSDFLKKRKVYKNQMFTHLENAKTLADKIDKIGDNIDVKDMNKLKSELDNELYLADKFNKYQLLEKVKANSIYGASGLKTSVFYNLHTAISTTMTGQVLISMAGMAFEAFLANNVLFYGMNECLEFINNVVREDRKYSDDNYISQNITDFMVLDKLKSTFYDKTTIREDILSTIVGNLNQEDLNRLYYKNNIYEFLRNDKLKSMLKTSLNSVVEFKDPNEIPKEIEGSMMEIYDLLKEYVLYNYEIYDRIDRLKHHERQIVVTIDTDSNFINLDPWFRFILDEVLLEDLYDKVDRAEVFVEHMAYLRDYEEYEFTEQDEADMEEANEYIKDYKYDANQLRFRVLNYGCSIMTFMIADVIARYAKNTNIKDKEKAALLKLKNELLIDRMVLTTSKKNYGSIVMLKEGVELPRGKQLDLKGLDIAKSTSTKDTQVVLQNILEHFILRRTKVNIGIVLKEMQKLESEIYDNLMTGGTKYLKPTKVSEFQTYADPMSEQGVKGTIVWNSIYPKEPITLPDRVFIAKMKPVGLDDLSKLRDIEPEIFEALKDEVFDSEIPELRKNGIKVIAIPQDMEQLPEWMIEFLDTETIISDVTAKFRKILYSLGTKQICTRSNNIHYSSIIDF